MPEKSSGTIKLDERAASDDTPTVATIEDDGAPSTRSPADRYLVDRVLGQGGMGTVYLVRDTVIGRHVALKKIHRSAGSADDDTGAARFRREARVQGQLEHPAVVPVYDVGISPEGTPFFTMKRVRGQSLTELLSSSSGPGQRKLLTAFSQLCLAVHYAHERGVVHRDIKPSNIMLGSYGEVYLLDWGVAKLASDVEMREKADSQETIGSGDNSGVKTGFGVLMGTPRTMSPEQAVGGRVDARSDVYALGAVLFEILTRQPLHPRGSTDEVIQQITRGVDARASVRVPDANVPPELEAICVKATRLDPNDRLATAKELHEAVEAYLDGDRDLSARKEAARRHAERAEQLAEEKDDARREAALREVGRALAFDPENKGALKTLVKLLTTPPKTVPREVQDEQAQMIRRHQRLGGIAAVLLYGYIMFTGFQAVWLGAPNWSAFTGEQMLWACAMGAGLVTVWKPNYFTLMAAYVFGVTACTLLSTIYSPFVLVPPLLAMHAVLFSFVRPRRLRVAVVLIAMTAWTIAVYGDRWGLLPTTIVYLDGDIVLRARAIGAPAEAMTSYIYLAELAMVVGPPLVIGMFRMQWHRADEATRLQAWQLRRLVSDETIIPHDTSAR
jgi:serine/threonine protein kinase